MRVWRCKSAIFQATENFKIPAESAGPEDSKMGRNSSVAWKMAKLELSKVHYLGFLGLVPFSIIQFFPPSREGAKKGGQQPKLPKSHFASHRPHFWSEPQVSYTIGKPSSRRSFCTPWTKDWPMYMVRKAKGRFWPSRIFLLGANATSWSMQSWSSSLNGSMIHLMNKSWGSPEPWQWLTVLQLSGWILWFHKTQLPWITWPA